MPDSRLQALFRNSPALFRREFLSCPGSGTEQPWQEDPMGLALGMIVLGVATFVALLGFVEICDRV
jgi:hypothetical protein